MKTRKIENRLITARVQGLSRGCEYKGLAKGSTSEITEQFYILNVVVTQMYTWDKTVQRGAWVAQSVKRPTLNFGSGHDLMVQDPRPTSGSMLTARNLLGIPSLPLCLPLTPLKINKH